MKLVFLGGKGELTNVVYNALAEKYSFEKVIIEDPVPLKIFLKKRCRKLGFWKVAGQSAFIFFVVPVLRYTSQKRLSEISALYQLNFRDDYKNEENFFHTNSCNSEECINLLRSISPDLIIVNGTRILNKKLLEATSAKIINMHLGITPKYRGVHGAYWALYNHDREHAGVTVHLVDEGIDTGGILHQDIIEITDCDNYYTYPYLQIGKGIQLDLQTIRDFEHGDMRSFDNGLPSELYSHPDIVQYLYSRFKKKLK